MELNLDLVSKREIGSRKHVHAVFAEVDGHAVDLTPAHADTNRERDPLTLRLPANLRNEKHAKNVSARRSLKGWQAIGEYLGIGAATAQRSAKNGMPVVARVVDSGSG